MPSEFVQKLFAQSVACNTLGDLSDAAATEKAMIKFLNRCNVDYRQLRAKYLPKEMMRFPFDSARKRMSTIVELEQNEKTEHNYPKRLHVKGASEIVLATCNSYLDSAGNKQILDDKMMQ